jgi:hypothetical protein
VRDVIGTVARIRSILVLFVAVYGIIIYLYASGAQDLFAGVLPRKFKVLLLNFFFKNERMRSWKDSKNGAEDAE